MSEYAVPVEDALARLDVIPDYDPGDGPRPCVHTFAASAFGLLGAHWALADVKAHFSRWGVEQAGPTMRGMGHGLAVVSQEDGHDRALFFATRDQEEAA